MLVPRAEDVLLALDEEKEALGHIEVVTNEEKREKGNRFIANPAEAKTYGDVPKFYKKICSIPIHAQASHRILCIVSPIMTASSLMGIWMKGSMVQAETISKKDG